MPLKKVKKIKNEKLKESEKEPKQEKPTRNELVTKEPELLTATSLTSISSLSSVNSLSESETSINSIKEVPKKRKKHHAAAETDEKKVPHESSRMKDIVDDLKEIEKAKKHHHRRHHTHNEVDASIPTLPTTQSPKILPPTPSLLSISHHPQIPSHVIETKKIEPKIIEVKVPIVEEKIPTPTPVQEVMESKHKSKYNKKNRLRNKTPRKARPSISLASSLRKSSSSSLDSPTFSGMSINSVGSETSLNSLASIESINELYQNETVKEEAQKRHKVKLVDNYMHFTSISHIYEEGESLEGDDEYSEQSETEEEEEEKSMQLPDMSWILENSPEKSEMKEEILDKEKDPYLDIRLALKVVTISGRFPFDVFPAPQTGRICLQRKTLRKQADFIAITATVGLLSLMSILSFGKILFIHPDTNTAEGHYENFEKLMLQKHWLYAVLFILTSVVAFVGNLAIFFTQNSIISFFNGFGHRLVEINYGMEASEGFVAFIVLHFASTLMDIVFLIALVSAEGGGFGEAQKFQSLLITRWFSETGYFEPHIDYLRWFLLVLELGIYFIARNLIVLVLIPCYVIMNLAETWNFRIKVHLAKIPPEELASLEAVRKKITYEGILKEHVIITKCVKHISDSFTAILTTYFSLKILGICCELFRFATAFLLKIGTELDLKFVEIEREDGRYDTGIKFDTTPQEAMLEIFYFSLSSILGLLVSSYTISAVGETVMRGFGPVRRYGLVLAKNAKERKFILSLQMSFNAASPHLIKPGSWFSVDRGFIAGLLGASLLIFSMMIGCQITNLVEVPIVLPCSGSKGICTKTLILNVESRDNLSAHAAKQIEKRNLQPPPIFVTETSRLHQTTETFKTTTEKATIFNTDTTSTNPISTTKPVPTNPTTTATTSTTTLSTSTTTTQPPLIIVKPITTPSLSSCLPKRFQNIPSHTDLDLRTKCGYFCPYFPRSKDKGVSPPLSHIHRMSLFNAQGVRVDPKFASSDSFHFQTEYPYECIVNPYKHLSLDAKMYDCFGNCFQELDAFNHHALSLDPRPLPKIALKFSSGFSAECHSPIDPNSKTFHPLEFCGIPYPYLQLSINSINSSFIQEPIDLPPSKLFPPNTFSILSPRCHAPYDIQSLEEQFALNLTQNITWIDGTEIERMVPFSYLYPIPGGLPIPLDLGPGAEDKETRTKRLFAYPYTYLHPKITATKSKTTKKTIYYSAGYHDCFGKPLEVFDDCGGLPFSIPSDEDRMPRVPKLHVVTSGKGTRYMCYESWISDYACGVPANRKDLVDSICELWAQYVSSVRNLL